MEYASADGAANMAADEALARSAAEGRASLRFYGWTTATLSLGYFQPCAVRLADARLARLPWVRRPSGGAALVHHHELTYALAVPPGAPWQSGVPWLSRMHDIIRTALADLGLTDELQPMGKTPIKHGDILCFQQFTSDDLLSRGSKVVGSAQRKYRQALMQHGSILLAQSEHTPVLPGIRETLGLTLSASLVQDSILRALARQTGWRIELGDWTDQEMGWIEELVNQKYAMAAWNEKR